MNIQGKRGQVTLAWKNISAVGSIKVSSINLLVVGINNVIIKQVYSAIGIFAKNC
jgi:hypothetical protein